MSSKILVTGGAGYIGSHVVRQLGEAGYDLVVLDDLSTGHDWAVLAGELVRGDLFDCELLDSLLGQHKFAAVLHFAARIVVPESVADPLKYYRNNTANTLNLIEACARHGIRRFVFSSTAAVYGIPDSDAVREDSPLLPINPYGASKMMSERMLMDYATASDMRYVILRYFNVAGADPDGRIGQATPEATHLIKVACETALGKRGKLQVFGNDYATADGTCIRDYIHVEDLARAHLDALTYLSDGNASSQVLNCGYGHGYSVLDVINTVKKCSQTEFAVEVTGRRAGDSPALIAVSDRIRDVLHWQPRHDDLDFIVRTAYEWEKILADRHGRKH